MSQYTEFNSKIATIRYFEQPEKVLVVRPTNKTKRFELQKLFNHLNTMLQVTSTNKASDGSSFFKLDPNSTANIPELLKAFGFSGGIESTDASSLGDQPEEPKAPSAPQQENLGVGYALDVLSESTYRTASYWLDLLKPAGKASRSDLSEKDILRVRRIYTRKPRSEGRNKVLRGLDRAYRYFIRKLNKEVGPQAADEFKERYRVIGNLIPSDYSEKDGLDPSLSTQYPDQKSDTGQTPDASSIEQALDFKDFFSSGDDADEEVDPYERFETEE